MRDTDPTAIYAQMVAYAGENELQIRESIDRLMKDRAGIELTLGTAAHTFVWMLAYEMSVQWAVVEDAFRRDGIPREEVMARRVEFSSAIGMMVTSAIQSMLGRVEDDNQGRVH